MADNIIKGIIQVEAPGVANVTGQVSTNLNKVEQGFKKLQSSSNSANLALINTGRVVQDLPYGFLGIANNLNPLLESFQRLKAETGTTGSAFSALASSLAGPAGIGVALSVVSSALISFGGSLFGSKRASEESDEALNKYKATIDSTKRSVDELTQSVNFLNQLGALNLKIIGFGDLANLREQSIAQAQLIADLKAKRAAFVQANAGITSDSKLSSKQQEQAQKEYLSALRDIDKSIEDELNKQTIIYRQIELQKKTDQDDANKKANEQNKKRLADLKAAHDAEIEELKRFNKLHEELAKGQDLKPVSLLDDIFLNSKRGLDELERVSKEASGLYRDIKPPKIDSFEWKGFSKLGAKEMGFAKQAEEINGLLTPAINSMIDAIARGKNAFAAFGDLVKNVLASVAAKLIETAVLAGVLSALTGGTFGGTKGFGGIFKKLLGFAGGGYPPVGRASIVGENGPELFVPQVPGAIIPNSQLGSYGGRGVAMNGLLQVRISGRDLVGVMRMEDLSQGRLV